MYGLTRLKDAMLAEALRSISGVRRPSAGADAACRRVAEEARKAGTLADACIGELRPQGGSQGWTSHARYILDSLHFFGSLYDTS